MSKLLIIFGITGQQGSAVATHILSHPELSTQFHIRGITRDVTSTSAQKWTDKGVELVRADLDDATSLEHALTGAHTVFCMTNSTYSRSAKDLEIGQGKHLANACVTAGVSHLIWSTLPSATEVSNGKLTHVGHFDAKAEVETYIRTLPIKATFFSPGVFMQNFASYFQAHPDGQGGFVIRNFVNPSTTLPLIDITSDAGRYIAAILQYPHETYSKFILAAAGIWTFQDAVDIMSRISGKRVYYQQIPEDQWKQFLPEHMAREMSEMMILFQDYGYAGPETGEMMREGRDVVEGNVTAFEDFVENNLARLGLA
jgi:uncharacterized protein YbjT (DUF2867 family)